jgi:hypothetical protein
VTDPTVSGGSLVLTQEELDALKAMITSQDRAGFYLTYYAMTGNVAALIQAQIATFSGNLGGMAFVANRLLQTEFGADGTESPNGIYSGIYALSQQVAASALSAIQNDVTNGGTGGVSVNAFFNSASTAWANADLSNYFPFNAIDALVNADPSQLSLVNTPGAVAVYDALPYAPLLGKQITDLSTQELR